MAINHKNFAETTLAAAITDTDGTSITVTSSASFPAVDFIIAIDTEAMLVTNVSGTTWTVTRGYESSTAATHLNGATVYHNISAGEVDALVDGPASATDGNLAVFDGATGKLIKDGGAVPAAGLPTTGGTMTGNIVMDNMDVTLVKLLTLHGEIDDGNSSTACTIDWNAGTAHKSTLTGNVTFAFTGYNFLVPDMTSNTAPSGVVSSNDASAWAWYVFGRDAGVGENYQANDWIQYAFPEGQTATVTNYGLATDNDAYRATGWKVQGSNNGTDFTDLSVHTADSSITTTETYYTVESPGAYRYYRFLITAGSETTRFKYINYYSGIGNPSAPCFLTLKLVQDGTGGRTVTWPATVKGTPAVNLAANATSNVLFYWDGTNYWVLNGKQFASATDKIIGRSTAGAGELEEIACTAAGRALLDDATAADQLTTLGALPLAGGTMSGNITLGENTAVALDPAGSADEKWSGITISGTAGATLAVGDLCYLDATATEWLLADADAATTSGSVVLGLCLTAANDGQATKMLLNGTMRSAAFPASITLGAPVYVSTTAGDITATQPSGTDDVVRVVGWAVTAEPNTIYFNPSPDYITHT